MRTRTIFFFLALFLMVVVSFRLDGQTSLGVPGFDDRGRMASSAPTRASPIVITSDLDWITYASSGDGSAGNPWIIENLLIECNATGTGIAVSGTTDYAIIRGCYINESGSGAIDVGMLVMSASNIRVSNCTFEYNNVDVAFVSTTNCNLTRSTSTYPTTNTGIILDNFDDGIIHDVVCTNGSILATRLLTAADSDNMSIIGCNIEMPSQLTYANNLLIVNSTLNGPLIYQVNVMDATNCNFTGGFRLTTATNLIVSTCNFNLTGGDAVDSTWGPVSNVSIVSCTAVNTGSFFTADNDDSNLLIANNTCMNVAKIVNLNDCENVTVENNVASNSTAGIYSYLGKGLVILRNNSIDHVSAIAIQVLSGNQTQILNNTLFSIGYGIYVSSSIDVTIKGNDVKHLMIDDGISVASSQRVLIENNYVYAPGNSTNFEAPTALQVHTGTNITIRYNTFEKANGTADGYGTSIGGASNNITVEYNTYLDCWFGVAAFQTMPGNVTVRYNKFKGVFNPFEEHTLNSCVFGYNYYYEYFNTFPHDITLNTSTNELESDYLAYHHRSHPYDPILLRYDLHPLYHAPWYPRNQIIYLQFDSVVTGAEVPFGNLKVYIDGVQISTTSPTVPNVLFRLQIYDYNMVRYLDAIYNLNSTPVYFIQELHIAPQCFFAFYSSIDNFGLEFSLVKLYVNNTRVTTASPVMLSEITRVTIRDYANSILYDQFLNLSVTGIYLDIGLKITTITFSNEYNKTILFYLTKGSVTTTFVIPKLTSITVRLAMGDYDYEITDLKGNKLESGDLTFAFDDTASFFVVFGKVSLAPPGLPSVDTTSALILAGVIVAGVLGAMLAFAKLFARSKNSKERSGSGKSLYRAGRTKYKGKYIIT